MNKKYFSISFITSISLFLIIFVISAGIIIWIFASTQKIINYNVNEYFKQTNNISKIILDNQRNDLNDIAFEISTILNSTENMQEIENEIGNITSIGQIDLLFIQDREKVEDLSNTLFDTKNILEEILKLDISLDNVILGITLDEENYVILLSRKKLIDFETGRVKSIVYVGKILNDNFSFINNIKTSALLEDVSIFFDDELIATSSNKTLIELSKFDEKPIYKDEQDIYFKKQLEIFDNKKITLVYSTKNSTFSILKDEYLNIGYLLFSFVIFSFIVFYLFSNRLILKPFNNLLEFAKKAKNNKNVVYQESSVLEFNNFALDLKSIIDELRDVKEQYSRAIEGVQDGLWDINLQNHTIYCSNRYLSMLGYNLDSNNFDLDFWKKSVHKKDYRKTLRKLSAHLNGKASLYEDDYRFKCADGSYKWIKIRGKVFFDEFNIPIRMTGFHTDIDEFVKLQNENSKKEQMLYQQAKLASMGEMIGNIAHQWRQPLNVISTTASSQILELELGINKEKDLKENLQKIVDTVFYLSDIIEKFRHFFNPSKELEEFYLDKAIDENIEILKVSYKSNNIILIKNLENTKIRGYKFELMQVIINLINNAKDALLTNLSQGDKKFVFIKSEVKDDMLEIKVSDNALGIKDSIKNKIYEPYFTTKHKAQGTGLGLYMSSEIIKKHFNGSLSNHTIEYEYQNKKYKGEEFIIKIPI